MNSEQESFGKKNEKIESNNTYNSQGDMNEKSEGSFANSQNDELISIESNEGSQNENSDFSLLNQSSESTKSLSSNLVYSYSYFSSSSETSNNSENQRGNSRSRSIYPSKRILHKQRRISRETPTRTNNKSKLFRLRNRLQEREQKLKECGLEITSREIKYDLSAKERETIVRIAHEISHKDAANYFNLPPLIVRIWMIQYEKNGIKGLQTDYNKTKVRKNYSQEEKIEMVQGVLEMGQNEVSKITGVTSNLLNRWKLKYLKFGADGLQSMRGKNQPSSFTREEQMRMLECMDSLGPISDTTLNAWKKNLENGEAI